MRPCPDSAPSMPQVEATLRTATNRWVRFKYQPQRQPRTGTPSVWKAKADTLSLPPPGYVLCWLGPNSFKVSSTGAVYVCVRNYKRRKKLPDGQGYLAKWYREGQPLWRSYLLTGIVLSTVKANARGYRKLFPKA